MLPGWGEPVGSSWPNTIAGRILLQPSQCFIRRLRARTPDRKRRLSWPRGKLACRKSKEQVLPMITRKQFVDMKSVLSVKQERQPRRKRPCRMFLIAGLCLLAIGIVGGTIGYPV